MKRILEQLIKLFAADSKELEELMASVDGTLSNSAKSRLDNELQSLYAVPPKVAVIGKTGVGKSSTINALFNPKKPVRIGHVVATTKKPQIIDVQIDPEKGDISIIDFPGLGESLQADEKYIPIYKDILPSCDVILWVLKSDDRALAEEQRYVRDILTPQCKEKLVIGLNQIDIIQPGVWIDTYNVPSKSQKKSIERKVKDVKEKFAYVGVNERQVIPYSATRRFRLTELFDAMLAACPRERVWVLTGRQNVAPYTAPAVTGQVASPGAPPPP